MLFLTHSQWKYCIWWIGRLSWSKENANVEYFENVVENGAFAHYEQMLHFPQYLKLSSATETSKGVCIYEVNG